MGAVTNASLELLVKTTLRPPIQENTAALLALAFETVKIARPSASDAEIETEVLGIYHRMQKATLVL
jgi:hypothetical protein